MNGTCDEILTDEDGFRARCMVTRGVEHSHHDCTARESVERGNQLEATLAQLATLGCDDCRGVTEDPDRLACSNCDRVFAEEVCPHGRTPRIVCAACAADDDAEPSIRGWLAEHHPELGL